MRGTSAWCRRRQLGDSAREGVGRGQRGPTVETQTETSVLALQARAGPGSPVPGMTTFAGSVWALLAVAVRSATPRSHGAGARSTETPLLSNEVSVFNAGKKKGF